ncbi:ABC-2 type transport system ATP-binding protein [Kytococcus aerolatus]|uniref:ABC-2 type transport system ATP-binding protein n=1 Tax=Kytococcus aerolatus TaxID=592308 RepID=A0A212TDA4_9MICO|nr:ATP-binding cassette domain-containing protein [Kytococcus aerolatus]SNC64003.1 ABC-2 type transport system ATP-binding protein [Kytococcus aerolatus]
MSTPILQTHELTREFVRREKVPGRRFARRRTTLRAVDGLTVTVRRGEAVGYIGANGAGKSTTIKMLAGILVPTSGEVRTCGLDPVRQRRDLARRIGVVFGQRSQLWWDLPLAESFTILAAVHGLSAARRDARVAELVDRLEMGPQMSTPVRSLSLGQRMRGEVAAALLHSPELVVLDEPTIGLDVLSKQRLREFLREERREHGTTLLLTTHDMGDIQRLCDRVLVVDHGSLVYDGALAGLSAKVGAERVLVADLAGPQPRLDGIPDAQVVDYEAEGARQKLAFDATHTTAAAVLAAVSERADVRDLSLEEPDIEDVVRRLYEQNRP